MSDKLLIAQYKDNIIKLSEYQESIHHGKIYCPFCSPPIRVTYNNKGFFMAWRNDGGHNCGKEQVKYFDADWKGRKITELSRTQVGELEITIDICSLIKSSNLSTSLNIENTTHIKNNYNKNAFPKYRNTDREEVFRDVVRSVFQMKKMLEKNSYKFLRGLKFKFKTNEGEVLTLNDVVIRIDELNKSLIGKSRFVIFKVDTIKATSNETIFINSLSVNNVNLSAKFEYLTNKNPFKNLNNHYVIAFGNISYSNKYNKYFITLSNDFQIRKLKEEVASELFTEAEFKKYEYKTVASKIENSNNKQNVYIHDSSKNGLDKRTMINTTINNTKKQSVYISNIENDNSKNSTIIKINSNYSNDIEDKVKVKTSYHQTNVNECKNKEKHGVFFKVKKLLGRIF